MAITLDGTNGITGPATKAIVGTTTNDSAAAGYVGEYVEGIASNVSWPTSSNQYGSIVSITLTAGDWDISAILQAVDNTASWAGIEFGVSTSSGNNTTGMTLGVNWVWDYFASVASSDYKPYSIPSYRVSISGSTTYYLKVLSVYTVATPIAYGRISARRVR
jgi:hypothetical protein